eukprot:GILK01011900.1.p1 GENE.GILK01011900.1~~GILK01011900.1.p1  ORF type:complete len:637 (-),score=90.97 GILK01011900.1:178-1983(-)
MPTERSSSIRDERDFHDAFRILTSQGKVKDAVNLVNRLTMAGSKPGVSVFTRLLTLCAQSRHAELGKTVHQMILTSALVPDVFLLNALLNMYAKCHDINNALAVFNRLSEQKAGPNTVSYNIIIAALARVGRSEQALNLFAEMRKRGLPVTQITITAVLRACSNSRSLTDDSLRIFQSMQTDLHIRPNLFHYNVVIHSLCRSERLSEAMALYADMKGKDIKPDILTYTTLLSGCADVGALGVGIQLHQELTASGLRVDTVANNVLLNMYARCGDIEKAVSIFEHMKYTKALTAVTWTTMIGAFGQHGRGEEALNTFHQMKQHGFSPDPEAVVAVLSACSHAGLVDRAVDIFNGSSNSIQSNQRVASCMVDAYARAGRVTEATALANSMASTDVVPWFSLLSASRSIGDVETAEKAVAQIRSIDPNDSSGKLASALVLLANTYSKVGRQQEANQLRDKMKGDGLRKEPGLSFIEVDGKIHAFRVEDSTHESREDIYTELERLTAEMIQAGYIPDVSVVTKDVTLAEKRRSLCLHSERLAMVFGMLKSPAGVPIRVMKNLRVCADCHNATKILSAVTKREFIVRDPTRFHHFKDGKCSCGDFW